VIELPVRQHGHDHRCRSAVTKTAYRD